MPSQRPGVPPSQKPAPESVAESNSLRPKPAPARSTSLKNDAAISVLSNIGVAFTTFFQYRLISGLWANADYASYSQVFRVRNQVEWIVLLVLPTALATRISALKSLKDDKEERVYTWTGLTISTALLLFVMGMNYLFPSFAALVFFGNKDLAQWVVPFSNLLFGYALALTVLAILRGYMRYRLANMLLFLYSGLVPVLCPFLMRGQPLTTVLSVTGYASLSVAIIFLGLLIKNEYERAAPIWAGLAHHRRVAWDLITFGAPRIVAATCVTTLSVLLPWYAYHQNDAPLVAALNSVLLVLGGSAIFITGMGFVLLPRMSHLLADGKNQEARRQLGIVVEFALFAGGVVALIATGMLAPFLSFWLKHKVYVPPALIGASCFVIPTIFVLETLRPPIDAASRAPWNAVSYGVGTVISFTVLELLLAAKVSLLDAISIALVTSYIFAAIIALVVAHRLYRLEISIPKLAAPLVIMVAALCLLVTEQSRVSPIIMFLSSLVGLTVFAAISISMKPVWLSELVPKSLMKRLSRGGG